MAQHGHEGGDADEGDGCEGEPCAAHHPRAQEACVEQDRQGLRREDRQGDDRVRGRVPVDRQQANPDRRAAGDEPGRADRQP